MGEAPLPLSKGGLSSRDEGNAREDSQLWASRNASLKDRLVHTTSVDNFSRYLPRELLCPFDIDKFQPLFGSLPLLLPLGVAVSNRKIKIRATK